MANRPDNEVELDRLELRFAATRVSDARAVQRLVQSIDACGQLIACVAVVPSPPLSSPPLSSPPVSDPDEQADAPPLVLIDGYRRVAALRKLGRDTALVECWRCSVAQALAQLLARSRSRAFTAVEEALLLRDLVDGQCLSQREAARQCGRDVSWVQRRLQLLGEVPEAVLQAVCREQVSTWSAVRVFVPLARANAEHAARLLARIGQPQQALSTRELNTWFAQYRCAQRGQRERMVEHPRLFIDSINERERERAARQLKGGPEQQAVAALGYLPSSDLLSFEQIVRLVKAFKVLGVRKVRITGGEPLLRRDVERLIGQLADLGDLELTLTTNGSLLARKAVALRAAGLHRLTVSLDAFDETTFRAMNDVDFPLSGVLDGIAAAEAAGFKPIKINMVVRRGVNDHAILPMARHFRHTGHILRFIEFMDVGATNGWKMDSVLPSAQVTARIDGEHPIEAVDPNYRGEVAERWRYRDGAGEIGVISSVTQTFCRQCGRARMSPEGKLFTCLFAADGFDLRSLLRSGASDAEIASRLAAAWSARTDRYSEMRSSATGPQSRIEMSYIGG